MLVSTITGPDRSACSHPSSLGLFVVRGLALPTHIWGFIGFLFTNFVIDVANGFFVLLSLFLHLFPWENSGRFEPTLTLVPMFCFYFEDLAHVCISQKYNHSWGFSGAYVPARKATCREVLGIWEAL